MTAVARVAALDATGSIASAPNILGLALAIGAIGVATAAWSDHRRRRTARARCRARDLDGHARPDAPPGPRGVSRSWVRVETVVGRAARSLVGRSRDGARDARAGRAVLVGAVLLVGGSGPVVAVVGGFAVWAGPMVSASRRRKRRRRAILGETPEIVELIRLGVASGLNVRLALVAVTRHHDGVIAGEVRTALARVERGERLADVLDAVAIDIDPVRPLIDALVATERYGAPLVNPLDRVAADARTASRRRAEELARQVPVKLLFPLVFCTLPAFVLLTVVPVLLRSLPSFAP